MNKAVMISIQPKWCELIANGKKCIEVRKTRPKLDTPFKAYIYCTLPPKEELFTHGGIREYANELIRLQDGRIVYGYSMQLCCDNENRPYSRDNFLCKKVIGEFVCDEIIQINASNMIAAYFNKPYGTCLTDEELVLYSNGNPLYGWHISDLLIYDKPKELNEFKRLDGRKITRPPQSWCYVEGLKWQKALSKQTESGATSATDMRQA